MTTSFPEAAPVYGGAQMPPPAYGAAQVLPPPELDPYGDYIFNPKLTQAITTWSGWRPIGTVCLNLFLPWCMFGCMFAARSTQVRYFHPQVSQLLCGLGLLVILYVAYRIWKVHKQLGIYPQFATTLFWSRFGLGLLGVAWVAGILFGDANFFLNMQPYFDILQLEVYPNVDPTKMNGQQVMDAGQVKFVAGTTVDTKYSMGFHDLEWYCVAPIVHGGVSNTSHDFWAVGTNCCKGPSTQPTKFSCGEYDNPAALSGLRLMKDEQRPFFRLAVQQAEAKYGIKSLQPLFFYFMEKPQEELAAYVEGGFKYAITGFFACVLVNVACLMLAVIWHMCKATGLDPTTYEW